MQYTINPVYTKHFINIPHLNTMHSIVNLFITYTYILYQD